MTLTQSSSPSPINPLAEEIDFFDRSLAEWMNRVPGKVVLIKNRELIGVFDSEESALEEGAKRFQLQPFLMRRVQTAARQTHVPALTLGILSAHADPSFSSH